MVRVTIRILDGAGRGRVFENLEPPVTIGREEGNSIQVNDDRVSRYHLKIQEDHEKIVLTDLESTNGTKVNGEDIQLRILRHGDLITVGRSVLLFGSREEINERLNQLQEGGIAQTRRDENSEDLSDLPSGVFDSHPDGGMPGTLPALEAPDLPERLTPGQAAQLSELLEYLHLRIRRVLAQARPDAEEKVTVGQHVWQDFVDLQAQLAEYLRRVGEP